MKNVASTYVPLHQKENELPNNSTNVFVLNHFDFFEKKWQNLCTC